MIVSYLKKIFDALYLEVFILAHEEIFMDKILSGLLFGLLSFLAGQAFSLDSTQSGTQDLTAQEKQVIESVEKGASAALPETGAGMPQDSKSDCE